jgi:hypothetical protein
MLKAGVHPKIVQEHLGHGSIILTLDLYSHVTGGLQETAAQRFEEMLNPQVLSILINADLPGENVGRQPGGLNVSRTGLEPVTG